MSNSSLFVTLFCKWPKTRRSRVYFWRIIALVVFIIGGFQILIHLNEIPTKIVNIDFDGYEVDTANVALTVFLGRNTNLQERFDPTFRNAFVNSNRDGVILDVDASGIVGNYLLYDDVLEGKAFLKKRFPQESSNLESMNAMLRLHMIETDVNRRLRMFNVVEDFDTLSRKVQHGDTVDCYVFGGSQTTRETKKKKEIVVRDMFHYYFFRNSIGVTGTAKNSSVHTSFLYNRSIWQASDISQAYVGIHLSSHLHRISRSDSLCIPTLSIDFGSPVTLAPDSISMTGMSFIAPETVQKIIRDGLVFHVTFDQNKNLQAVKLFGITTFIAALFGVLLNQVFKWWNYKAQKRRLEKRLKERRMQQSDGGCDSNVE